MSDVFKEVRPIDSISYQVSIGRVKFLGAQHGMADEEHDVSVGRDWFSIHWGDGRNPQYYEWSTDADGEYYGDPTGCPPCQVYEPTASPDPTGKWCEFEEAVIKWVTDYQRAIA